MVAQRLLEVQFGESGARVRSLLLAGDTTAAQELLARMEASAATHPWLKDKVQRLKELAERDAVLAQKELRYNQVKMSSRLSSDDVLLYAADETDRGDIPAFLRRKSSEGKGRKT
jgi:Ca-activated chloride channel family protein